MSHHQFRRGERAGYGMLEVARHFVHRRDRGTEKHEHRAQLSGNALTIVTWSLQVGLLASILLDLDRTS
jgi:hypothetical protein